MKKNILTLTTFELSTFVSDVQLSKLLIALSKGIQDGLGLPDFLTHDDTEFRIESRS